MEPHPAILRVALLGVDGTTPALVRAIHASSRFELVGVCESESAADSAIIESFGATVAHLHRFEVWESLLDSERVDAVLVARGVDEDRRVEQLRKLIQTGIPLLVSHPVSESMLVYYELDMIRRETGCVVLPYLPARCHPAARELKALVDRGADSPIGIVEQLIVQRCIGQPTKAAVTAQFARDVDLIRGIAGEMTRLGAMAAGGEQATYGGLGVQMTGSGGLLARWSVDPAQAGDGAHVSLLGPGGRVVARARPDLEDWSLETTVGGRTSTRQFAAWDPAAAALAELDSAIAGRPAEPDWVDAARSVELAETIDRSLQKGRTIELYYEDYTEEGTFKGTMTSVGCGLLLLGLFLLGAVAIAEQLGVPYVRTWPYFLLGVLGIFLVLQLLRLVFRSDEGDVKRPSSAADPSELR